MSSAQTFNFIKNENICVYIYVYDKHIYIIIKVET